MPTSSIQSDLDLLRDEGQSFFRRADAVRRLARCAEDEAHRAVLLALRDKEAYVRRAAAEGLGHDPRPDDLEAVLQAFAEDKDEQVRRTLLKTLGGFADPRALEVVQEVAEKGSYSLRYDAQSAVSRIQRGLADLAVSPVAEPDEGAAAPTPLRPPPESQSEPLPAARLEAPEPEPVPEAEPPPEAVSAPEPREEKPPAIASAGVLEFRSFVLHESFLWVPAALWPALVLLVWIGGFHAGSWWTQALGLGLVLWRRGVQFDGFTKSFWRWSGAVFPMRKRLCDYAGMTQVEVCEGLSPLPEILPEVCRTYMSLELGSYDVVLVHSLEGRIRLKRFRNLAAALVAAQQVAEFLALPTVVNQQGKSD